jgi:hypothetical protein
MTAAAVLAFYKNRYPQRVVENLVSFGKPTFQSLPKKDDLTGYKTYIPLQLDAGQGLSATIGNAVGNASAVQGVAFAVEPSGFYAGISIDAKTMLAARDNEGAFFRIREREYESTLDQMGQKFEAALWSNGTGSMGTISNEPAGATATATLVNPEDAIKYHKNQKINFYADSGGSPTGAARTGSPYTVLSVNYVTGVITFTANLDAAVAAGDHMVTQGDLNLIAKGIPAWIPPTGAPASIFGVTRTDDPQKLAGWQGSWLGSIEESAKVLDSSIRRVNQKPKTLWLSYANFVRLDLELGARAIREADKGDHSFGSMSLKMLSPGGGIEVRTGPYVPEDYAWLLDMSAWEIHTLGKVPHLVQDDGLTAVRVGFGSSAEDSIEMRLRAFWTPVCVNPFAQGVFPIV